MWVNRNAVCAGSVSLADALAMPLTEVAVSWT
jgi:hypothetical protein